MPDLMQWLQKLSDAVSCEPKIGTVEAYLEELGRWKLTDDQWSELRRRAVLRHRFPRILPLLAELDDIRGEIVQDAERKESSKRLEEMRSGVCEPCPPEVAEQMRRLFAVRPEN
jgi:hypothetical protein